MFSQKYFFIAILVICVVLFSSIFFFKNSYGIYLNDKFDNCRESRPCISLCSKKNEFTDEEIKANITQFVKYQSYDEKKYDEIRSFEIHWTQLSCKNFDTIIKDYYDFISLELVSFFFHQNFNFLSFWKIKGSLLYVRRERIFTRWALHRCSQCIRQDEISCSYLWDKLWIFIYDQHH